VCYLGTDRGGEGCVIVHAFLKGTAADATRHGAKWESLGLIVMSRQKTRRKQKIRNRKRRFAQRRNPDTKKTKGEYTNE
jgi:hypothetical protein